MTPSLCRPGKSHHWLIPETYGLVLHGQCKYCKKKRTFSQEAAQPDHSHNKNAISAESHLQAMERPRKDNGFL